MSKSVVTWAKENPTVLLTVGGALLLWLIWRTPSKVAEDVGRGAVNVVRGAVTGVADEAGKIIGIPSMYDVTDDPFVARYMIDHPRGGYLRASGYATPVALARAALMSEFSGHLPLAGSRISVEFPPPVGYEGALP